MVDCDICYMPKDVKVDLMQLRCGHCFCTECVEAYLENLINTRKIEGLKCPQYGCKINLKFEEFDKLVSLEKYNKFKQEFVVMKDPNQVFCPNAKCGQVTKVKDKTRKSKATCEHCSLQFCGSCLVEWTKHGDDGSKECDEVLQQEMGAWYSKGNFQRCPKCHVRVEKVSGCNHMTCASCHLKFCWICGQSCTYAHYLPFNPFGCPGMLVSPS